MVQIKGKTIHLTRGDIAILAITVKNDDGTDYNFRPNDVVRFKVMKRKDCNSILLQKDVAGVEGTSVDIFLTSDETKIGEVINKPVTYWYEVELNPDTLPQTIIGYDESGEKQLILYPEGSDE